mgnify:CR=1 FL=1
MEKNYSYYRQVWKRLLRNRPAVFGLLIITVTLLVAIFAYAVAPDNSPNADLQTVEIQAMKPGHSQLFLLLPDSTPARNGVIDAFFNGTIPGARYVPITGYAVHGNQLAVQKYIDEDTAITQFYNISTLTSNKPHELENLLVTRKFLLGTDAYGRDILSRLMIGTRVSLAVGSVALLISLLLGITLGALAGYYRGWVDAIVMWFVNISWSIPTLLLAFAFSMALGKGFWQVFVAIGLTMWVSVARLVRGQVMAVKEMEYVQAAEALGYTDRRIIIRHILPNIIGPVMVIAAGNFASAIIIEAGLSFLGIGVQPPMPSWGLMIKENYNFIITHNPFLAVVPGLAIMLLVLAFNLVGNGLRDALSE